jgi:hypothetical protein
MSEYINEEQSNEEEILKDVKGYWEYNFPPLIQSLI